MGRPKGSKNTKPLQKVPAKTKSPAQKKTVVLKPENEENLKSEVFAVPVIETPLFMCRRCQGAFETTQEYTQHLCPVQVYNVALDNEPEPETPSEYTIAEIIEEAGESSEEQEKPVKKQRKPYKKREKKEGEEKASKEPVQCPTCQKKFTRKYHLERHLVHTSCNPGNIQKDEFSCEVCSKKFSRIDNLRMHLRAHLGQKSRSRDFQCPFCEKSFYGSSLLNIHVRTHTREKPYLCDWEGCGKGFPSSGALTKHR
jgi:5-methylcytosine-specific restriction endonuclease McrA